MFVLYHTVLLYMLSFVLRKWKCFIFFNNIISVQVNQSALLNVLKCVCVSCELCSCKETGRATARPTFTPKYCGFVLALLFRSPIICSVACLHNSLFQVITPSQLQTDTGLPFLLPLIARSLCLLHTSERMMGPERLGRSWWSHPRSCLLHNSVI